MKLECRERSFYTIDILALALGFVEIRVVTNYAERAE